MKKATTLLFILLMLGATNVKAKNSSDVSIYDYLKTDGHFNSTVRLIDDLNYTATLSQTLNKTLFVANDSAFIEFFKNNKWGVTSYGQLTVAQKKYLLLFSMMNNAYTLTNLANYTSEDATYNLVLNIGSALRQTNALLVTDSIPYLSGDQLSVGKYWDSKRSGGCYLLSDNTLLPTIFFTQAFMNKNAITDEDLKILSGIDSRAYNDVNVFNDKVLKGDIDCKNGYIHVLQSVLIPPTNMAQFITDNVYGDAGQTTKIFSRLLDRFCAPYFDANITNLYHQTNPGFSDSIFVKKYFSFYGGNRSLPSGFPIQYFLPYNPGWNSYEKSGSALQADMAAMFVPSDEAMTNYFNAGILKIYGSWDNVPDEMIVSFLQRHMRNSLIASMPGKFNKMLDAENNSLGVEKGDIVKTYTAVNGEVYVTNKVYPPFSFTSTYSPLMIGNNTKIMDWVIKNYANGVFTYKLILSSMSAKYSLFVPTDESFTRYIDPVAISTAVPGAIKFWYNAAKSSVNATVYKYDKQTATVGDSVGVITSSAFILNRLVDLLNTHIVVGEVQSDKSFYMTRGNVPLKIEGSDNLMSVQEGGNISLNEQAMVSSIYNQSNGKTYFIDKPLQAPLSSVYKVLSEKPEFSQFFALLNGFPVESSSCIFVNKINNYGIDFNVKLFSAFNYTVYVPTNSAIQNAIDQGIITPWVSQGTIVGINDMVNANDKAAAILKLERFLRYHFQDQSVFVDQQAAKKLYLSATIKNDNTTTSFGTMKNRFYKIAVESTTGGITLTSESGRIAHVNLTDGLYNILSRDYVFNKKPSLFKNIDGTGAGSEFYTSQIYTSSSAVIHQIDNVLTFE